VHIELSMKRYDPRRLGCEFHFPPQHPLFFFFKKKGRAKPPSIMVR
jgi:hypothetical protein